MMKASSDANRLTVAASSKERWGWYLFDFANSILIINGGLYFPQWIVVDQGVSELWFNLVFTLSTVLLIATGPLLGILSDRGWGRVSFLRYTSVAMFIAGCVIGLGGRFIIDHDLRVVSCLVSFFVIMYSYQLSIIFYNVLLARVSSPQEAASVSGRGFSWGWLGGIVAVLFILPFVQGNVPLFQPAGRIQAILPSALLFGVLTIVSLLLLRRDDVPAKDARMPVDLVQLYKDWFSGLREAKGNVSIWLFLLSYFFFSDAILTIQNNSTLYMEVVYGFSDNIKAYQFLSVLFFGAIGGFATGYIARRYGLIKPLLGALVGWVVAVLCAAAVYNAVVFTVLFALMGFLNGVVWSISRVLFLKLVPSLRRGEYFGLYAVFERFASILGPLVWSAPVVLLRSTGALRYQFAMLAMGLLLGCSVLFLRRLKSNDVAAMT